MTDGVDELGGRDPERIPEILSRLETVWRAHPQLRLTQLLFIAATHCGTADPFYLEDAQVLEALESYTAARTKTGEQGSNHPDEAQR